MFQQLSQICIKNNKTLQIDRKLLFQFLSSMNRVILINTIRLYHVVIFYWRIHHCGLNAGVSTTDVKKKMKHGAAEVVLDLQQQY